MKIKVDVNNVTIIEKSDIHKGEYNINKCIFEFSSEYTKDLIYRAVFSCINGSYYQLILNNECNIPEEILREKDVNIELGVYAYILNDDNELELRYSPKPTYFRVENGSYKDADKTEVPSPTDYEKFLNEFNRNATQKTNEYNKNADKRIEEINNKVSDIEKIEDNIEQIQKNVQVSEQKVKDSEISAQNSAKKASESESNIISIEKNINGLKKDIDNTKTQIDEKAKEVKDNSDIAIEQAKLATQQATLSGQNANKTSADKEDISQMKVSIETSEDNIEKIEKNVQAIKNDTEALKEETLQAKEEVENSLENERIISDKKYARAIDSEVIEIDNFGQVEVDDDGYMKDIEIESTLPEIAQDIREGYNKFNIDTVLTGGIEIETGEILANGSWKTSEYIEVKELTEYLFSWQSDSNFFQISYAFYDENKNFISASKYEKHNIYSFIIETAENIKYIRIAYSVRVNSIDVNRDNIQLIEGTEEKPYEEYGASPSLDYPSEFKNTLSSFNIKNTVDEIEKYNKQITLLENKFLGIFNGYKNYIKDNKLKSNLKIVEFTETLDWTYHEPENKFMCSIPSNAKIKDISLPQLCSHYKTKSSFASNENEFACTVNGFRFHNDNNMSLEEWKTFLAQQKEAGTPLQILYISNEEETELEDINLPLYKGINNISAEDLKVSFKYNVSIEKYIENNNITERKISDNKYARALKTQLEDIEQIQVYAENDEVENLTIKGTELTQKTREGYNQLKNTGASRTHNGIDFTVNADGTVLANGTANGGTSGTLLSQINIHDEEIIFETGAYTIQDCKAYVVYEDNSYEWFDGLTKATSKTFDKSFKITDVYIQVNPGTTVNNKLYYPMITKGTENKEYEQYGASPSLDYPSEVEITKEQKISIFRKNILDTNDINKSSSGITTISKNDGGININGTSTSTFLTIKSIDLNVPIKAGTKLFMNYGKTEKLLKDNTDFSPYFWLVNKNGTLFKTLNRNNIINGYSVEQEIYRISFGIEALVVGKEYSEDIYIELEISDKRPTQFKKYEAAELSIALENSAIKEYADSVDRENNTQNKLIEELVLTGKNSENWILGETKTITQVFCLQNSYNLYVASNPHIMSNYFINQAGDTEKFSIADKLYIAVNKTRASTVEEFRSLLSQLNESGNPLKIYLVKREVDKISLPKEVKQELDKFKLYDDLNNIFIDKGSLSFKYNKSLLRAFEEQSELSASLLERIQALEQAQVNQVGGN